MFARQTVARIRKKSEWAPVAERGVPGGNWRPGAPALAPEMLVRSWV